MPSRWNNFCTMWFLAALAVICVNAFMAKAHGQQIAIVRAPLTNYSAITTCDQENHPVIVVNQSVTSEEYAFIITHESVHVEQMKRSKGGCHALLEEYRTKPEVRFALEAEAYCADFNERVKNGMPKEFIVKLATYLQPQYASGKTVTEVQALLPCGKDVPIPKDGTAVIPP